jgi:glycosyltransferase involved in cell wall biosynthesis
MPPAKSGIADYSATLAHELAELSKIVKVEVFSSARQPFDPTAFDIALYQIGNNGDHDFCYRTALEHPGVVVIHEANLHHLIADLTIKTGDWDAYMQYVIEEGDQAAIDYSQRVRRLEVGPDYDGLPMLRRLLNRSKAAVVHSAHVERALRQAGFEKPIARIHHGAWIPEASRAGYRSKLGLDETTPLIGIFGYLKPYKRIAESLRAFRRIVRLDPRAKMILVGEAHPELPLESMVQSLDLGANVRLLGRQPIDDFVGYLAACDIVLNLRFPTVGENSGTLMRALGLGKAVIVSEVGSFCELPPSICLKAPVDQTEEDHLFEYLNVLVSRPEFRRELGARARAWVERECSWPKVARDYADFLEWIVSPDGREQPAATAEVVVNSAPEAATYAPAEPVRIAVEPEYIRSWAPDAGAANYVETHVTRFEKTLAITPPGGPGDRILEMGAYLQITPALKSRLGYSEVRGCYYGPAGRTDHRTVTSSDGEEFSCDLDLFDAERDRFPYPDAYFSTVLCCELIEHLTADPMHLMSEVNRILKIGGHLVITTPNLTSLRAIAGILSGYHPGLFSSYIRPRADGEEPEARHNREYTPREIARLLVDSGFEITLLDTGPFREEPRPEHEWVKHLLARYELSPELRGEGTYAVGRKAGPLVHRYPDWLYQ